MRLVLKVLLTCILCTVFCIVLYFIIVIGYSTILEFNPEKKSPLKIENQSKILINDSTTISFISWNIGYAGLGKEMDFFYEGGKMVRPTNDLNAKYFSGIESFISNNQDADFFLFQEVDLDSKRSFHYNQYESIGNLLTSHSSVFAKNYKSWFVPIPLTKPMGKVSSGMATFSKFKPIESNRISTPGSHSWPTRLFMLKRCLIITKYQVGKGKNLVVINIHNSAFSDEDDLRKKELALLKELLLVEYAKGNYVIAGGDWNQNPATMKEFDFKKYIGRKNWPIEAGFLPANWNWVYDSSLPTNRSVNIPFDKSKTETTLIDFFVTSPNVEVLETKTIDLGFEHSDHHPVKMSIKLGY